MICSYLFVLFIHFLVQSFPTAFLTFNPMHMISGDTLPAMPRYKSPTPMPSAKMLGLLTHHYKPHAFLDILVDLAKCPYISSLTIHPFIWSRHCSGVNTSYPTTTCTLHDSMIWFRCQMDHSHYSVSFYYFSLMLPFSHNFDHNCHNKGDALILTRLSDYQSQVSSLRFEIYN